MNAALAIAIYLMTNPYGVSAIEGHMWSYERIDDSAMLCIENQCIIIPDVIDATQSPPTPEERGA